MINYKSDLTAFLVAIGLSVVLGFVIIPVLKALKAGQNVLGYVDNHAGKAGTTTMGGFIFAISTIITFILFFKEDSDLALLSLFVSFCFLIVGFLDDFIKIKSGNNQGLTAKQKLIFQTAISFLTALFVYFRGYTNFFLPFFNEYVEFSVLGAVIVFFVFVATTNCVNLTDGLDGLAGGVSYIFLALLYLLIQVQTHFYANNYVIVGEVYSLARLSLISAGALLGFLVFNTFSAKVFMGDTGSLYIGGLIAVLSIFSSNVLFIPFFGIMFVVSGISVIIQVAVYKKKGKRVFLMAPLHHHFEYKGYSESKIVFAYKLITLVIGVFCILTIS